ncbi:MAG: aspartate/tyrosine/aromatic aminotransferase [Deltaproteobacteria bacterium]|nr:aspartate/tyrosine/aromatic aminotransferase [Deltaproteobacteria bacterium]
MSSSPFARVEQAPPDPILSLADLFRQETNPKKVNLGVGIYLNDQGVNPVLKAVKQAEKLLLEQETTKNYLGMDGDPDYGRLTQHLLFGADHPVVKDKRAATLHTPGGTGALRAGGDFLRGVLGVKTLWVSDPTWPNHKGVFNAAGLDVKTYPYYDAAANQIKFSEMTAALAKIPAGDAVLFHACCHNPTGIDPTTAQWKDMVALAAKGGWIPFIDFAYQGFGGEPEADAESVRLFAGAGVGFLVANSYSKNFGLYRERTGALTLVAADAAEAGRVMSQAKLTVRANWSNPPAHGGLAVKTILMDAALTQLWREELTAMRERIWSMRKLFVKTLKDKGVQRDFSFLEKQAGMFSFSGISKDQVLALRAKYGIYMVENGRINVAGMTTGNMDYLCSAVADVLKG